MCLVPFVATVLVKLTALPLFWKFGSIVGIRKEVHEPLNRILRLFVLALLVSLVPVLAGAQKKKPAKAETEDDYYKLLRFETPPGEVLEAGAIEIMPDGKVAVGTRRGEIWMIDNAYAADPKEAKFTRFAHGLHEVLGLAQKDGWLYVTQRPGRDAHQGHQRRRQGRRLRGRHRRLGDQRRLSRVRLRLRASTRTATSGSRSA